MGRVLDVLHCNIKRYNSKSILVPHLQQLAKTIGEEARIVVVYVRYAGYCMLYLTLLP